MIPGPVTTRAAGAADVELLAGVFLAALRDAITASRGTWDEPRERAQFLAQLDLADTRLIEHAGRPAGFVTVSARRGAVYLHTLCVREALQGRGIGSTVVQDVVREAHARGLDVVLTVLKTNPRARALYERLGFIADGEATHHHWLRHAAPGRNADAGRAAAVASSGRRAERA